MNKHSKGLFPESEDYYEKLFLPLYYSLTDEEFEMVTKTLTKILK